MIDRGHHILGPEVARFERAWGEFCGAKAAVGVATGTDALTLALLSSGAIEPGRSDEVITSPLTAGYTALAILRAGAVPVFVDIDPERYTLAPAAVRSAVSKRTKAVLPVHLYGAPAEMEPLMAIASEHGLAVIEDCAQAHGARCNGQPVGTFGVAAAFSFYPTKNLGAVGDGGAVVSNDLSVIERCKLLRQGAHPAAMEQCIVGCNSRLDEIQAALLSEKLPYLRRWTERRREIAARYLQEIRGGSVVLPRSSSDDYAVYHLFVIRHPKRDRLREHLQRAGIETLVHYPYLLHQQPLFSGETKQTLPEAERAVAEILSLPLYPGLSDEEVSRVVLAVNSF